MKKIYNLAAALLVSSVVFGQRVQPQYVPAFQTVDIEEDYQKLLEQKRTLQLQRTGSKEALDKVRVSHADERIAAASGLTNYVSPIFPDSLPTQVFTGSGTGGVQAHAIGGIFDPTSEDFVLINSAIDERDDYFLDSIHVGGAYTIVNPGSIDTLRVQMFVSTSGAGSDAFNDGISIALTGHPHDGAELRALRFTSSSAHGVQASSSASGIKTFDYIFSNSDTSGSLRYYSIPVEMDVPSGNLFGWFAQYIPGTTWTNADIYFDQTGPNETLNAFMTFGSQEATTADVLFAYDPTSFGSSATLFNDGRYQQSPTPFINNTIPPGLSGTNFADYTFSTESSSVGINDVAEASNATLGNNYPNPFNNTTKISYSLTKNSNVQFEVTDITGKVVVSLNEGSKQVGVYNIELSADLFQSGLYYYSIITDSGKMTKKMIVVE